MDLFGLPFCNQVAWTYMIILCSGCTDLYNFHFVLMLHGPIWLLFFVCRSHGPIWYAFCTQVTWTYFACVNSQHRGTLDSDSYFCHSALRPYGPIWLPFLHSGHTDVQVTQTYMIGILHSSCMDLLYLLQLSLQTTLKYYNAALCHPHLPFIPTIYTCTVYTIL